MRRLLCTALVGCVLEVALSTTGTQEMNGMTNSHQMYYPWARRQSRNYHFEERQNEILNSLRNDLRLQLLSDTLPVGMGADNSIYIHNSEGQKFSCHSNSLTETRGGGVKDKMNNETSPDNSMITYEKSFKVIDKLRNFCVLFAIDWWSYEWCHRKEIKQFHLEENRKTKQSFRKPEWSLGTYTYSDYFSNEVDESTVEEVVDYFEGGQRCDETNEGRKTEVHIHCCNDDNAITYKSVDGIPPDKIITFQQLQETKTCSYRVDVCTPLLCDEFQHADRPEKLKSLTLLEYMDFFRSVCLQRQENWWTYEICFGGKLANEENDRSKALATSKNEKTPPSGNDSKKFQGIRQYHVETMLTKTEVDNQVVQKHVIQAEFTLGLPPVHMYKNESALSAAIHFPTDVSSTLNDNQPQVPSLHLEFSGGAECDIESVQRSVTVDLTCGERDGINDIIEDRTCHYVFKMSSKLLCRVAGFSPPKREESEIMCLPESQHSDNVAAESRDANGGNGTDQFNGAAEETKMQQSIEQEVSAM